MAYVRECFDRGRKKNYHCEEKKKRRTDEGDEAELPLRGDEETGEKKRNCQFKFGSTGFFSELAREPAMHCMQVLIKQTDMWDLLKNSVKCSPCIVR
jgi:hypothetical protein